MEATDAVRHLRDATTARANNITLFASLELSKSKWVVTINSPGSEKFSKHVVEGGDGACLLDLLSRSRAKAEQRYGVQVKAIVPGGSRSSRSGRREARPETRTISPR